MVSPKMIVASALAIATTCGVVLAHGLRPRAGSTLSTPSSSGRCPALDWHVAVGPRIRSVGCSLGRHEGDGPCDWVRDTCRTLHDDRDGGGGQGRVATITGQVET